MADIVIKNKRTGITRDVTTREWEAIQKNPTVAKAWVMVSSTVEKPVEAKKAAIKAETKNSESNK